LDKTEIQYETTQENSSLKEKNFEYYTQMLFKNKKKTDKNDKTENNEENKKAFKSLDNSKKDSIIGDNNNYSLDFNASIITTNANTNTNKIVDLEKRFNYNSSKIAFTHMSKSKNANVDRDCNKDCKDIIIVTEKNILMTHTTEQIDSFHKLEEFLNGLDDSDLVENECDTDNNNNKILSNKNTDYIIIAQAEAAQKEINAANLFVKEKEAIGGNVSFNQSENKNPNLTEEGAKKTTATTQIIEDEFCKENNKLLNYFSIADKNINSKSNNVNSDYDLNERPDKFNFYSLSFDKKKLPESIEQKRKFNSNKLKESENHVNNFSNQKVLSIESLLKSDYNISFSVRFTKLFYFLFLNFLFYQIKFNKIIRANFFF